MSNGTTQRDINAKERARLALSLRRSGATLDEIAQQCGYADKSGAWRAIKRELDNLPAEDAEQLRKLEMIRLDHLTAVCYKRLLDNKREKPDSVLWVVDRLIALAERRSKLMGLDVKPDELLANQNYVKKIVLTHEQEGQHASIPNS